jgi:hypothetical protein
MSSPLSFEHLADIRDGARRMAERTRAHEGDLNQLVETADRVRRQATALVVALTRADTNADGLSRLCSSQRRACSGNRSSVRSRARTARRGAPPVPLNRQWARDCTHA